MEEPIIRLMALDEAPIVLRGQRKAFSSLFGLFLSRPKEALVAESEGRIVGAVTFKSIPTIKGKAGYLDIAYVDASQRGKHLGSRLYVAAMEHLKEQGCEIITATIRDDNRASWKIMQHNGCVALSFVQLVEKVGFAGALRIGAHSHFAYALGHELWVTHDPIPHSNIRTLLAFILLNFLLLLIAARGAVFFTFGGMVVLAAEVVGSWLGTFSSRNRATWYFQRPHAALPLSFFVSIVQGLLPNNAVWQLVEGHYPVSERKSLLGRVSLAGWIATSLATIASYMALEAGVGNDVVESVLEGMVNLGILLLFYRTVAVFPFESFGGRRVFDWSRWRFWFMAVVSVAIILFIF
jgi:ribosomal protein S18 acetylase RimI-like enzyme